MCNIKQTVAHEFLRALLECRNFTGLLCNFIWISSTSQDFYRKYEKYPPLLSRLNFLQHNYFNNCQQNFFSYDGLLSIILNFVMYTFQLILIATMILLLGLRYITRQRKQGNWFRWFILLLQEIMANMKVIPTHGDWRKHIVIVCSYILWSWHEKYIRWEIVV